MSIVNNFDLKSGKLYKVKPPSINGKGSIALYENQNNETHAIIILDEEIIVLFLSLAKRDHRNYERYVLYKDELYYIDGFSLFEKIEGLNYD